MFDLLKRYQTIAVFALYALVTAVLVATAPRDSAAPSLGGLGAVARGASGAAQSAYGAGLAGVAQAWDRYVGLVRVREENETLRRELERLREEQTRLIGVMQENARLRSMVGFSESRPEIDVVPAAVLAKPASPFFRVLSIRLATRDPRVQPGLPVVAGAGVVGHVAEVTGRHVDVLLATDPRSSIDVVVQRNRARGIVQGVAGRNDYLARVAYLHRREQVEVGDVVVTSGLDGRFPADVVVGRVAAVHHASHGLFQEVWMEPAVDFGRVEEAFVLIPGT